MKGAKFKDSLQELYFMVRPILFFIVSLLVIFSVGRLSFTWYKSADIAASFTYNELLLNGLRLDISTIGYLLVPLILLFTLGGFWGQFGGKFNNCAKIMLGLLLGLIVAISILMEASTPAFLNEYGVRPNRFFVEYLKYPTEVVNLLLKGHLASLIVSCLLFVTSFLGASFFFIRKIDFSRKVGLIFLLVFLVLGEGMAVCMARSSLGHRPLNPAMVAFSSNPMVNELVLNSTYSLFYAMSRMQTGKSSIDYYGNLGVDQVVSILNQQSCRTPEMFSVATKNAPTRSYNKAFVKRAKPLNIVVLLQESFGAQYVKSLGGMDIAPNFDKLSNEGWAFKEAYATGTRSIRGIEAVITGFLPTPQPAVLKQDRAQQYFFTLPRILAENGYKTSFIYGGEAHFDNMKSFFLSNGVHEIIEQKDYKNPVFVGSWGVSDEDLYAKANEFFQNESKKGQPFFSLVFSSSNHDPYEFPNTHLELNQYKERTRINAVRYADLALGKFIETAKKEEYWNNTLFLIIADHDSRVSGEKLIPVKHFKIPALIMGADISPKVDNRLVSQIDMAPTLLSLAGIDSSYPMPGRDLNRICDSGIAIMQYNQNFGYMWKENGSDKKHLIVLSPGAKVQGFEVDKDNTTYKEVTYSPEKIKIAHAWGIAGEVLYKNDFFLSKDRTNYK